MHSATVGMPYVTYRDRSGKSVADILARAGIPVISMAEVRAHKAAELAAAPKKTPLGWFMKMYAMFSYRYNGVTVRGPARWERRAVDPRYCGAPETIVARAERALREVPGRIQIDELVQDKVVLDPIMYLVTGPSWWETKTPIGIWKDDVVIR